MSKKVVIASACRTAVGSMGGQLSTVPAAEMGAVVIKEALKRAGVAPEQVDHVFRGRTGLFGGCFLFEIQLRFTHFCAPSETSPNLVVIMR